MSKQSLTRGEFQDFLSRGKSRQLKPGDVIKFVDGSFHFVQYVNSSGAYAVPLAGVVREIAGNTVNFTAGGKTISATSLVEHVEPLSMGGNSQEYRRCVKMLEELRGGGMANKRNGKSKGDKNRDVNGKMGVSLGEFDSTDVGSGAAEGRSAGAGAEMPDSRSEDVSMANVKADKTAKAGNGKDSKFLQPYRSYASASRSFCIAQTNAPRR